jgi:hypothetical protein
MYLLETGENINGARTAVHPSHVKTWMKVHKSRRSVLVTSCKSQDLETQV